MSGDEGVVRVHGHGEEDEVAAAIAAVMALLTEHRETLPSGPDRWKRSGRLEAQGIIPTERALLRGWSVE